jgi:hypothetical protein
MAEPAGNFEQPHDRNARLYALGLDEATIEKIVLHGLLARQACSPFSPPSYPGTVQWAETTIGSRQFLVPKDWTPDNSHGFPRVVSPDGKIAIFVATGDERTGIATAEPRTKYSKGPETTAAVAMNEQLAFQLEGPLAQAPLQRETWAVLLTTNAYEMRYELSCPMGQDKRGRVVSWSSRIIFPPIEIDGLPGRDDDHRDDDDGGAGGIDVPVERI